MLQLNINRNIWIRHFIEQSPAVAIGQAKEEIIRMGEFSVQGLQESFEYLKTGNKKHAETAYQIEDAINNLRSQNYGLSC